MDLPNAFIGQKDAPNDAQVVASLGLSLPLWTELLAWLNSKEIASGEWRSASPKYGWALRPSKGKRTILYLGPCDGCFRVSFVLGDRALAAAKASDLPKKLLKEMAEAKKYAEGTGVRVMVGKAQDLATVKKLVEIKLAH